MRITSLSRSKRYICLTLVAVILWQCDGVRFYAEAGTQRQQSPGSVAENRFDALLAEIKGVVKDGGIKTKVAPEKGFADSAKLAELKQSLIKENDKAQDYFRQSIDLLKQRGLPPEVLDRQFTFSREYAAKYEALMARLDGIEKAQRDGTGRVGELTGKSQS